MNAARMGNRVGTLHFIRFPTSEMDQFLQLAKSKGFASLSSTICATGGGAYKFESDFLKVSKVLPAPDMILKLFLFPKDVNLHLHKSDELESLIAGLLYIEENNQPSEVYYWANPTDEAKCTKVVYDFKSPYPFLVL